MRIFALVSETWVSLGEADTFLPPPLPERAIIKFGKALADGSDGVLVSWKGPTACAGVGTTGSECRSETPE